MGRVRGAMAFAVVAVASVAACGSAPPAFHPAGGMLTAAPSPPAASRLARFPFPADVHFDFDSPLPADPVRAAAVAADENFQLAYYYAIYSQGKDQRYRSYIGDRLVLASVQVTIAREAAVHEGFTGTIRFYATTAEPASWPGEQTVASCVNNSRLLDTDIRTGKVRPDPAAQPGPREFLESDILAKQGGAWRVVGTSVTYYPDGQAKECVS